MTNATPTTKGVTPPINAAGDGQVIPETRVKQGNTGSKTFIVLVVSTVLAIIVMFGVWSLLAGKMNHSVHANGAATAAASKAFDTGPSQPKATPNTPNP